MITSAFLSLYLALATPLPIVTPTPPASPTATQGPSAPPVPWSNVYPKGVWGLAGDRPADLGGNKGLVGVNLSVFWYEVEKSDGVYDFTGLDGKVKSAKAAGFAHLNVSVTASSENSPKWLVDELKAAGQTITFLDPGHEGTTYGRPIETPLPWNPRWHAKRLALYEAVAAHYKSDPAIVASFTSFANHRTADWNITDTVGTLINIPASACPPPAGSYVNGSLVTNADGSCDVSIDQPSQWLAKEFSRDKMLQVGKEIIATNAKAWTGKLLKLPIGGLDDRLANTSPDPRDDGSGNYSTLAWEIVHWIDAQPFAKQIYISRNTVSTAWGPPPTAEPGFHSEVYIKWMIAKRAPFSGLQTVSSASGCVPDGKTPCRQNGNQPTTSLKDVMQRSLDAMTSYKVTFAEEWFGDAKNPDFYAMTRAATIALGGTPRDTATPTPSPKPSPSPSATPTASQSPSPSATGTPTPNPTATPPIVNGIQQYGTASDGTKLNWQVYNPPGTAKVPFVVLIHGGGFRTGSPKECDGPAADLVRAGYAARPIYYRLDTDRLPGQSSTGKWHQQTDDCQMAVAAARKDSRCNGKVFAIGGSAGGTHAASLAILGNVEASVCLSGAYKFDDRTADPQHLPSQTRDFNDYTGTTSLPTQLSMSPITFVTSAAKPMYLVRSQNDPMPIAHQNALIAKLQAVHALGFQAITVPGNQHSFANWPAVSAKAITFLNAHLSSVSTENGNDEGYEGY